jgi:flagellar protein FlbT
MYRRARETQLALKVELRPGEKLLVGNCIITNSDQRTRLFIEGSAPILREKDIITPEATRTPAERVYLAIQMMYIEDDIEGVREEYFTLVNDLITAAPSMINLVDAINNEILTGSLYKALRIARQLIQYEQEILAHAQSGSAGLPAGGQNR